jgi:uncharacterized OB-fold protein
MKDPISVDQPGPEAVYAAHLREGRFRLQRSRNTRRCVFYPRVMISGTGETDLEWVEATGFGVISGITVNRTRNGSYNVALVELDEGPRMMSRIEGTESAPIGTRVKARIIEENGEPIVVFDPIEGNRGRELTMAHPLRGRAAVVGIW